MFGLGRFASHHKTFLKKFERTFCLQKKWRSKQKKVLKKQREKRSCQNLSAHEVVMAVTFFQDIIPSAMDSTDGSQQQQALAALLQKRIDLIGDHAFRDRDAQGHLAALREVSEALDATFLSLKPQLPPRLRHFMEQASYSKALEYLKQGSAGT